MSGARYPEQDLVPDLAERQNAYRLFHEWIAAMDRLIAAEHSGESAEMLDELAEAMNEAERIYDDCGVELYCDFSDEPQTCGMTGAPLRVGDELVYDPDTNQIFLRSVYGPPRTRRQMAGMLPRNMIHASAWPEAV